VKECLLSVGADIFAFQFAIKKFKDYSIMCTLVQALRLIWYTILHWLVLKKTILPVVAYGCETWSLTLRVEHRIKMFENRASRRIFGPKRDEVTGEWRKLHNEELNLLSPEFYI
jgi:hypothetical protein